MSSAPKDLRRQSVLDAATNVFARVGFHSATMDEVCREAKLSKGGIYRYVSSKDELFLEVATHNYGALASTVRAACKADGASSAYEELGGYVTGLLHFASAQPRGMRLLLQCEGTESLLDPASPSFGAYRKARGSLLALVVVALTRGRSDGSIRGDLSPMHLAATLRGALRGLLGVDMDAERDRDNTLPAASTADLVHMVMQLLRPSGHSES